MPHVIEISDLTAPELDVYARLTEAQLRSRRDPSRALFLAESTRAIAHALDAGYEPVSFLMERRRVTGSAAALLARCEGVPVYTGEDELLASLTGFSLSRGVLCALRRRPLPGLDEVCAGAKRLAVLEDVIDPTNVGAIFRAAAALGFDGVLLSPSCCDALHRRAVRVSMGTVFQIPWTRLENWPEGGLRELEARGFTTAALALDERALPIDDPALLRAEKLAVVLGTEGDGLSEHTVAECRYTACIPMSHDVDSLNVAAAASVAFWVLGDHTK